MSQQEQSARAILAATVAAFLAIPASAQTQSDFARIDTNGDGAISREEFEAARNRDFDLLDADGGGGTNTFEDRGGNEFESLRLSRFIDT